MSIENGSRLQVHAFSGCDNSCWFCSVSHCSDDDMNEAELLLILNDFE